MRLGESTFNKKKLALAVASVLAASSSASVLAQGEEELVVTGIRSSFQASQDIKANSKGVVDAISAEDMGKFPDSNVAESLQRITGVSISRRNGEGSQVTVRGFGPDFNMVTLNGRMMPSASIAGGASAITGGDSASRAFNMDNIASEGVAGVEVYKTSRADIASGGIGATINLKTTRPLDNDGLKFSVGAKALRDTTNEEGSDITPELSGLVSWSNDVFGASLSVSHQERDSGSSGAFVTDWQRAFVYDGSNLPGQPTATAAATADFGGTEPDIGQVVGEPADLRYFHADTERERTNGQLTLQYRPVESLTATLDYTYAEQTTVTSQSTISQWFQDFPRRNVQYDQSSTPTPVLLWERTAPNDDGDLLSRDTGSAQTYFNEKNELNSVGLNLEWQVNDELKLAFDVNDASSEAGADAPYGSVLNFNMAVNGSFAQGADFSGDIPTLYIDYRDGTRPNQVANGSNDGVYRANDIGSQILQVTDDFAETDVTQIRIDGTYEFSEEGSIDFGIERREMENSTTRATTNHTLGNWGVTNPGDVAALGGEFLRPIDYSDFFSINTGNQAFFDAGSGGQATPFTQGFALTDIPEASRRLLAQYQPGTSFDASSIPTSTDRTVAEDVTALYFQVGLDSALGEMPVSIQAGLRYESTDVESTAVVASTRVQWNSNDDFQFVTDPNATPNVFTEDGGYNHLLPNLDVGVDITDEIKGRFSYSTTIARAQYNNLNATEGVALQGTGGPTSPVILGNFAAPTAISGSPNIQPLESDNFDLSLEWYFGDASYASIGYFEKRVSNFIGQEPVQRNVLGITDPSNGPRAQAALAALNADGIAVTDTNLFSMMAAIASGEAFGSRTGDEWEEFAADNLGGGFFGAADDPELIYRVLTPVNINDAKIDGFEIAGQHFFGESGFGLAANYTIVNGNVGFDVDADPSVPQFALLGLSDTANLSLIYENFGFQGRISYNWRDDFLNNSSVAGNEPSFTEDYEQIDINLSYEITDGLFVSFEGINITEEDQRTHGRSARQLNTFTALGARYALGVRYTF